MDGSRHRSISRVWRAGNCCQHSHSRCQVRRVAVFLVLPALVFIFVVVVTFVVIVMQYLGVVEYNSTYQCVSYILTTVCLLRC